MHQEKMANKKKGRGPGPAREQGRTKNLSERGVRHRSPQKKRHLSYNLRSMKRKKKGRLRFRGARTGRALRG